MEATQYSLNRDQDWDENTYSRYYDDDSSESYINDDENIIDDIGGIIKTGANVASNIITGGLNLPGTLAKKAVSTVGNILGVNTSPATTTSIQNTSNLAGKIATAGGRQVPFTLPPNIATKQDISIIQGAIQKINSEIGKVASTTTNNGVALTKLTKEVQTVDSRHTAGSLKQNDLIKKLGAGVDKIGKDIKKMKSKEQMNMMMSMLMQPTLESITFAKKDDPAIEADGTTPYPVESSKSSDNTMLFMMMAMMGGNGEGESEQDGGAFGGMNPMMMFLLMDGMKK